MNSKVIFAFIAGAAVGVAVSWKVLETKFERIAQEEIDSVREMYTKKYAKPVSEEAEEEVHPEEPEDENAPTMMEYAAKLSEEGYTNYADVEKEEKKEKGGTKMKKDGPKVITPGEFGEMDDYETVTLMYYADKVVTDDDDIPISDEDVDVIIGLESLEHFGEYEPDCVYVRNDGLETDYEILLDVRTFADVHGND